ncbi:MAG: outer membrane protein assembly factor BamA, partial [bacterium]
MFKKILIITAVLFVATVAFDQVFSPSPLALETMLVGRVSVKNNVRIETSTILSKISLKPGSPFSPESVSRDIKALHKTGFFERVVVETLPLEGRLELIYTVYEKPYIKSVLFTGNDEFNDKKLREQLTVKPDTFLNLSEIYTADVKALKKFYSEDGFYLVEVEPVVKKISENWVDLTFKITENSKVKINEIIIEGNREISSDELKDAMKTGEHWFLSFVFGSGYLKKEQLDADMESLLGLYYRKGFIEAEVGTPEIILLEDKTGMNIRIKINEGPQYKAGKISFRGNRIFDSKTLLDKVSLEEGAVFDRSKVKESVRTISEEYANRGYLLTEVYPRTRPDRKNKTADLTFMVNEGQIVYANKIIISGNTKTIDKVIRREIRIKEGEIITRKKITRSYQRLTNLMFFDKIGVNTKPAKDPSKLDLTVNLHEKLTGSFNVGAGFSTLDKVIFNASLSEGNLMGWGKKAKLSFSLGAVNTTYNFSYTDPYFL